MKTFVAPSLLATILTLFLAAAPAQAVLSVAAEINPDPAQPSELVDVQITIASTATSGSLTLRVLWPQNLQGSTTITNGGSCPGSCSAGELLTWSLGTLAAGGNVTVGFNDLVSSSVANGTMIPFQIELLEGGVSRVLFTRSIEVQANSPLELVVDPLTDPVAPSGVLVYELTYGNNGAASAENAEMTFPLPAGTQFLSATGGGVLLGGTVTWDLGNIPANDGGKERVTVQVNALANGSLLWLDAAAVTGEVNFLPRTSRARAVSRVAGGSLQLAFEIGPDPAQPSELLEGQIIVSNLGDSTTGALELRLLFPEHLQGATTITGGGSCPGSCSRGEYLVWSLGNLGSSASLSVAFDDLISSSAASGTPIPFEIELLEAGRPARTVSHTVLVQASSPLEVVVDPLTDPVASGGVLTYELTYGNAGSSSANDAEMRFPLPAGTQFLTATGGGTHAGGVVTWDLGSIPANGVGSERVTVQIGALSSGTLLMVNAATISGEVDFLQRTSRGRAVSRVGSMAIELSAEINPDPLQPSELLDGQIFIANPTGTATGSLTLQLLFPEHLQGATTIAGGGGCVGSCSRGEYLVWVLGALGPGAAVTVGFDDLISSSVVSGTPIPFEIELFQGGLPARNTSHTVLVQSVSPLELLVDPLPDPVTVGGTLEYQLTYGNTGASSVESTTMRLPLPPGTQFLSATGGGTFANGTVTWSLGSLPPHGGGRERVSVQVTSTAKLLEIDDATIAGEVVFQPRFARAQAVSRLATDPLGLTTSITPDPVRPSQLLTAQFGVNNPTGSVTGTLTLRVLWPEHLQGSTTITGGGSCPGSCSRGEFLTWNLGTLGPGASANVGFTDLISSSIVDGTLIPFEIELLEGGLPARTRSHTLLAHPSTDHDMDGEADVFDPDDDNDGMPDWWESFYGLDPLDPSDAGEDPDGDGQTNLEEFLAGTNPTVPDVIFIDGFESGNTSAWSVTVP